MMARSGKMSLQCYLARKRSAFIRGQRDVSARRNPLLEAVPKLLLIASIAIYGYLILSGNGRAPMHPMDQGFVYVDLHIYYNGTNWVFGYPHLSWAGGITGSLIVGLYKLLIPTSVETLNWHVKILSATLFLASEFFLARTYKLDWLSQVAVLTIVATSGLLLLEPSTEVLAGAFLNFFGITIRWHRQATLQGLVLAVFSLIKVELLPIGVAVAVFWAFASGFPTKAKLAFFAAFVIGLAAFMAPAVYLYGSEGLLSGRAFDVFGFHYCTLVHGRGPECLRIEMPDAHSIRDVVERHTVDYLAFLGAATIKSLQNIFFTLNLLAFSAVLMIKPAFEVAQSEDGNLARVTLLVLVLTLAITLPFASIEPRYLTRILGLSLVAGFRGLRKAIGRDAPTRWAVVGVTTIIVAGNLLHFGDFLAAPHSF
jgi:hypothetical protein